MEQHPVPQNITGFQFKLIGDMTIRQFLYLAGGVLLSYLILQFGLPTLIKWFLAALAVGAGFAFAFVPIEERPLDRWLTSFLKSIYNPTQFLWKKRATAPEVLTREITASVPATQETLKKEQTAAQIEEYLLTLPTAPLGQLDQRETGLLSQITSFFDQTTPVSPLLAKTEPPAVPPPAAPVATGQPLPSPAPLNLKGKTEELTNKINSLQQELSSQTITKEKFLQIQSQLSSLLGEKERLTKELIGLKKILAEKPEAAVKPTAEAQAPEEARVKIVTSAIAPKIGMPKPPAAPNIISGLVKTQKGAILPSIIVEIRNQEGTPVRAIKTGKLGQFAISTPLANGTYTLRLEDPQKTFYFDIIEIALTGAIVPPLEIFAKTQKDLVKEELKKKLFSQDIF